ncbi:MAG: hypothetical protein KBD12_01495 [Candidatus Pacebacteria bacterium]|nr:hypothetical protein [Candidatus Paceibacterota bacterium]
MSTFQSLLQEEESVCNFIKEKPQVSYCVLKRNFSNTKIQELSIIIDNLCFESRIKRIYTEESQVPLYVVV